MSYEYKVIPAPVRGQKGKGVKGADGRFANALESAMNELAAEGWEYLRADTLPNEERSGLTGTNTSYRSVLVFRRAKAGDVANFQPEAIETPKVAELPAPMPEDPPATKPEVAAQPEQDATLRLEENDKTGASAAKDPEEGETVDGVPVALKKRVETLEQSK